VPIALFWQRFFVASARAGYAIVNHVDLAGEPPMLRKSDYRPALMVGTAALALLAAGCVSEQPQQYQSAAIAPYGAETLYHTNHVDDQRPSWGAMAQGSRLAQQMQGANEMAVAFRGVEGARLAHQLYGEVEAEKVDGNCGPLAKIENGETKKQLSQKIQDKIDAYAMAEGLTSTSDYAAQYKRGEWIERDGSPEQVAEALLSELETEFAKIEVPRRNGNDA
jgi:hypothetical protein